MKCEYDVGPRIVCIMFVSCSYSPTHNVFGQRPLLLSMSSVLLLHRFRQLYSIILTRLGCLGCVLIQIQLNIIITNNSLLTPLGHQETISSNLLNQRRKLEGKCNYVILNNPEFY